MIEWVLVMTLVTVDGYKQTSVYPKPFATASECHDEVKNQFFNPQSEYNAMMEPLWEQKKLRTSGLHCEKREANK